MRTILLPAALVAACLALGSGTPASAGRDSGFLVVLDANSGRQIASLRSNGAVVDAVADGHGGWFVGGSFTRLGGARRIGLAHLLPNGAVDPRWRARIGGASGRLGSVNALARASQRLFVGGSFGRVDGVTRPGLAAVDSRTGALARNWLPVPRVWIDIEDLQVAGRRLLVAGSWGLGIQALDASTGAAEPQWQPRVSPIPDAGFLLLVVHGWRVYVAGAFHIAGLRRNGLVALDARTGKPDRRWAPQVPNCHLCNGFGIVQALAASSARVYVTGYFSRIDSVRRDGLAALDPRTGRIDRTWTPAAGGTDVYALALAGSRLYLGGAHGLAALDSRTGARIPLPRGPLPGEVIRLAVFGNRLLAAGGG